MVVAGLLWFRCLMLREPCPHGRYERHYLDSMTELVGEACPGGRTLSDAEALERVLYEECGTCGGTGEKDDSCPTPDGGSCGYKVRCPVCGGSGRTPKDGVQKDWIGSTWGGGWTYVIPASMLEGDKT